MTKKNGNNKKNGNKVVEDAKLVPTVASEKTQKKYESLADEQKDFQAHKVLFNGMLGKDGKNEDDMRVLMSNIPMQAKPLMVNLEVAEAATDMNRTISLARVWLNKMLVYNVAVDRGARDDAIAVGQAQAEEQAANAQGKALFGQ